LVTNLPRIVARDALLYPASMPAPRPALVVPAIVLLAFAATGCRGPKPARAFVDQARRLHTDALVSAVSRQPDLAEYVQLLGDRLMAGAREAAPEKSRDPMFSRMKFHVVDVATVNVFTTGGEHVYVYAGLVAACDNEEELAAAMAHAVAHALNLDVQNLPIRPDPRGRQTPEAVAWQFVINRFNAQQEWAADKLAFGNYARAGWDPDRFGTLFTRLGDQYRGPTSVDRAPLSIRPEAARVSGVDPNRRWRRPPVADRRTFGEMRDAARTAAAEARQGMAAEVLLRALPNCILPADQPDQLQAQEVIRPAPPPQIPIEPS
jgi:predicted Zn-dependent protease